MRPRSLFLNLCRGFVVDHDALREHLLSGHIAGAAVDVFADEPKSAGDPFANSLQSIPNVILTPHIGGSTEEAQNRHRPVRRGEAAGLRRQWTHHDGGQPAAGADRQHRRAQQAAACPPQRARGAGHGQRLLANAHVNIESQVLSTRGELGYVITDIAGVLTTEVIDKLEDLPETVRLRVLA